MPLRIRNQRRWQSVDIEVTLCLVQSVQIRLHRGIINTEKFIRRGHHVDLVRFALRELFIHELVHRLVHRGILEIHTHQQEKCSA